MGTVRMEGLVVPLLLLVISLPSISCAEHCRPLSKDYDGVKCFVNVIGIIFGVLGAICLLVCCCAGFTYCSDNDEDTAAAPDPTDGEVQVKMTLMNKQSVKALESLLRTSASRGELGGVTALLDTG